MKILETERLILRPWTLKDVNDMYDYAKDERVGPLAGWPAHKNIEESKKIIKMFLRDKNVYAMYHKKDKKVIGSIGIHESYPDEKLKDLKQKELGFVLHPNYWGQGLVPEGVKYVIDYLFNEFKLDLIWCGHSDFNEKSKRVNEKCGFQYAFSKERVLPLLNNKKVLSLYYKQYRKGDIGNC